MSLWICKVCNRVLDLHTNEFGCEYWHAASDRPADHDPVPMPAPEGYTGGRCDFCNQDHPSFVVPARDFEVVPGHMSDGDWAACETCARLIERNDWTGLTDWTVLARGAREMRRVTDIEVTAIRRLHRLLRKNLKGGVTPL